MPDTETGAPPRLLIIVAVAVAVALAVAVAVVGLNSGSGESGGEADSGPLALPAAPAPAASSPECTALLEALPRELESGDSTLAKRELAEPAPQGARAWGGQGSGKPVVLRCGTQRPAELNKRSSLRVINHVQWLPVPGNSATTWYAVDRGVYVALTVPRGVGTGAIQAISDAIASTLEPKPLRFPG